MKNFYNSWIFNAIIAVLAAFFGIMQEVWLGTEGSFLAFFGLGSAVAICLSLCAEMSKKLFYYPWSNQNWIKGAACGIVLAFILALIV